MIFSAVALFALVASLVTPVLSAPVHIPNSNTELTEPHFSHRLFAKDSPTSLGSHHHGMSNILKRDGSSIDAFTGAHSPPIHSGAVGGVSESRLTTGRGSESPRLVRRKSIAAKIRGAFKKVGAGIKKVAQRIGSGIKKVAQKVATGVKTAAKKVGKFIKTTGAKVVKFGLKVVATAAKVVGRVASFIPGVGKGISKALGGVSTAANFASDKIHANLGKKLTKGMNVMNKIQHPVGGAAGKVLDAVFKRDMDDEHLFERDLPELETRSFEDGEGLEARSSEGEEIEARSFDDAYELEARSFKDFQELKARLWNFEEDET